jgi:uncharacterized protein with HEPN domain
MRSDRERLEDIAEAIERILERTAAGRAVFEQDLMLQVWVVHHLQIIGEAARTFSKEFLATHPHRVWSQAVGMRNIIVHHYFEIVPQVVWGVVENDLQPLRQLVAALLKQD